MFFDFKVCLTACFPHTLKEIEVGSYEFSWNQKIWFGWFPMISRHGAKKLLYP